MNSALPSAQQALRLLQQLVVTAYALSFASLLLVVGRLGGDSPRGGR
jgi:hypothetical protein